MSRVLTVQAALPAPTRVPCSRSPTVEPLSHTRLRRRNMSGTKYDKTETEHYADVSNHKIHYNDVGKGPALFCFHGGGPGANAWDNTKHNLDALADHFHLVLMDLPGYGLSDKEAKLNGEPLDFFWSRCVKEVADQLGIQRASLYASSQSNATAVRFG